MSKKNAVPRVSIVDYGMGNLFSVKKACESVGIDAKITTDKREMMESDALILPGVGAFGDAMENLRKNGLVGTIKEFVATGRPFVGICLGMQLLMTEGEEFGHHEGLGMIPGKVVKFPVKNGQGLKIKVPQVGWNRIRVRSIRGDLRDWSATLLEGLDAGAFVYFVHSYYVIPQSDDMTLSFSTYEGVEYCSSICCRNITAFQFHPEKSGENGIVVYRNLARMLCRGGN